MTAVGSNTPEIKQRAESGRIVILGGSGFIGTRMTKLLRDQGRAVSIGDLSRSDAFPELWAECDVRRSESINELLRGADVVVNLAAVHRDDVRPLSLYHETNVHGAEQVCEAARRAGVRRMVFTSSVAVYGFNPRPVDESGPFAPFNAYGETKLQAEQAYREWVQEDSDRTLVIVRPTVVFGENNRGNVYNLIHQIATGKFLMVGAGDNIKSIAYVGNVAAFLIHTLLLRAGTNVFNYVDGPDMQTSDLVDYIRGCLGKSGRTPRVPKSVAMTGGRIFDLAARLSGRTYPISAVRVQKFCETTQFRADRMRESGFEPPYTLKDGLARTIQFEFARGSSTDQKRDRLIRATID
jgi:nucleoside-diphosphate-sugar epimerase